MKKVLVCCGSAAVLQRLRRAAGEEYELTAAGSVFAPACEGYDAVLAVLPSPTHERAEQLRQAAREVPAGIVALVRAEEVREAEAAFAGLGIFVAAANAKNVRELLGAAVKTGERLRLFGRETVRLRSTIDDLKLIDRAKCALVRYLNMTESDAHRFIEKQAMNRHLPRREVALEILKTYES